MLHDHQPLLERVQRFNVVAWRSLRGENPLFNAVQFILQGVENWKVAIDDGVDDGIQDKAWTLAQQLRFSLTARTHFGQAFLCPAAYRDDVIGPRENGQLAHVIL